MSTYNIPYQYKKSPEIIPNTIMFAAMRFVLLDAKEV